MTPLKCRCCKQVKPMVEFHKDRSRPNGFSNRCMPCDRAENKRWREVNRAKNSKRASDWQRANPDRVSVRNSRWKKANTDKVNEQHARRRRPRTPWADQALIRDIYRYAKIMREHGVDCHVDHEVPLCGRNVSGLHTDANLTVLLAEHNLRKGNKHLPGAAA